MRGKKSWRVPVNGRMYKVKVVKGFSKKTGNVGLCNYTDKQITLCADQSHEELMATYLHEIIHAHDYESGWQQIIQGQAKELSADGRANFLLGVLNIKIKKF